MKKFLKEIIIILLLVLAIVLVLGVLFYDYIPMNKVVPKIEQYELPNNIKQELQESIKDTETESTPIVYEINDSDLMQYEKSKDYQKGKVNPFADTSKEVEDTTQSGKTTSSGTASSQTPSTTTNTTSNSEGSYLPTTGTK